MTPDLPDSPVDDWPDIEGSFDEVLEASAQQGMRRLSGETVTPDLPIPEEAAIEAGAQAYWDQERYTDEFDWTQLQAEDPDAAEVYRKAARTIVAAALPHLRSLQVETQVEYGRALGRKEAANQIKQLHKPFPFGKTCPECHTAWPCMTAAACLDLEYPGQNATSEPRTDLPVGPSHPKDSQTAREAL